HCPDRHRRRRGAVVGGPAEGSVTERGATCQRRFRPQRRAHCRGVGQARGPENPTALVVDDGDATHAHGSAPPFVRAAQGVRRIAALAVTLLLLLYSAPSASQATSHPGSSSGLPERERERHARSLYEEGLRHFNLAEYDAAIESFREAYRFVQDPELLFNI